MFDIKRTVPFVFPCYYYPMELTTFIIIFLCAIVVSNILDSAFPKLPLSLIQIGIGVLIALTSLDTKIELNPEIFLGVLVAPLLYREAEEADLGSMWKVRKEVVFMAFALVFATVLVIGFSLNAMVSVIPLAACFCLGGILGPTDAIAVNSMSKRININDKVMNILKGEFLINDASGVISFNFAAIALTTGAFSLGRASLSFVLVCLGGLVTGFVIGTLKNYALRALRRAEIQNTATFIIIEFLTPFICFFIAEAIGVSGIIAAVTAGLRQALQIRRVEIFEARFAVVKKSLWHMISFVFNSFIFILLGFELPLIVTYVRGHTEYSIGLAMIVGLLVIVVVYAVRFIGVLVAAYEMPGEGLKEKTRNRLILVFSGAKGTVSLAIAFALPLVLADGLPFHERDLVMFIAACAIIYSLIISTIVLPLVAKPRKKEIRNEGRIALMESIIERVEKIGNECRGTVIMRLKRRVFELKLEDIGPKEMRRYPRIRKEYFNTVEQVLEKKIESGKYSKIEVEEYHRVFAILGGFQNDSTLLRFRKRKLGFSFVGLLGTGRSQIKQDEAESALLDIGMERIEEMFWESMSDAIAIMRKKYDGVDEQLLSRVVEERIDSVNYIVKRVFGSDSLYEFNNLYNRYMKESYEIEREVVSEFVREGRISEEEADDIRIEINMLENYMIEEIQRNDATKLISNIAKRRRDPGKSKRGGKEGKDK